MAAGCVCGLSEMAGIEGELGVLDPALNAYSSFVRLAPSEAPALQNRGFSTWENRARVLSRGNRRRAQAEGEQF